MSTSKFLVIAIVVLVGLITLLNIPSKKEKSMPIDEVVEVEAVEAAAEIAAEEIIAPPPVVMNEEPFSLKSRSDDKDLPVDVDRIALLFQPYPPNLPFIETITYSSKVDWLTGRAAYLGDYASHYQTSKHFISRSLHGMGNYLSDIVSKGDRFNVYRKDKQLEFHLVLDLSRLKLWLYAHEKGEGVKVLLKSYRVCAGKLTPNTRSGSLTPLGTFALGNDFAVYTENVKGNFKNELREMITVYGVRWISLGKEIAGCTGSSKGLGLHGAPWRRHPETGELEEHRVCIGQYESSGCISLCTEDIEEIYALIVSKPAFIHIVSDFADAEVPGRELVF